MHDMPNPDLVGTTEATGMLNFKNPSSVARLVYEHKLAPAMRLAGGAYLFHRVDIERLAAERAAKRAS